MKNVLLINGSPRKKNTRRILTDIADILETNGITTEIVDIMGAFKGTTPFCVVCSQPCNTSCYKDSALAELYIKMEKANFIVIGSPVYFGSVTAQLKAVFDKSRALRGKKALVGKKGMAVTVGGSKYGGQESAARAIHDMMLVQGMTIVGCGSIEVDAGHQSICWDGVDEEYLKYRVESAANRIIDELNSDKQ